MDAVGCTPIAWIEPQSHKDWNLLTRMPGQLSRIKAEPVRSSVHLRVTRITGGADGQDPRGRPDDDVALAVRSPPLSHGLSARLTPHGPDASSVDHYWSS